MASNSCSKNLEKLVRSYRRGVISENILPTIMVIEPTNRCNIECIMCPSKYNRATNQMDFQLYTKIIRQSKDFVKTILLYFRGEPLLHTALIDMIEYGKKNTDARIIVSTNATLLTKELNERIIKSNLDCIVFSIDGDSKFTYENIKIGSNFGKVIKGVKEFVSLNNKLKDKVDIVIKLVRLDINDKEIEEFERKWTDLGCTVEISRLSSWANQMPNYIKCFGEHESNLPGTRLPCADLWYKCIVTYDGKVVLCCYDYKELEVLGNLKIQTLYEIWNSERIRHLRDLHLKGSFKDINPCKSCAEWSQEDDEYIHFPEFVFKGLGGRP